MTLKDIKKKHTLIGQELINAISNKEPQDTIKELKRQYDYWWNEYLKKEREISKIRGETL